MPNQYRKRKHDKDTTVEYTLPSTRFRKFSAQAEAEEEALSKILFGDSKSFLKSLEEAEQEPSSTSNEAVTLDSGIGEDESDECVNNKRKPAWTDEDDEATKVKNALKAQGRKLPKGGVNDPSNQYSNLLRHKFEATVGTPKWATLKNDEDHGSDSEDEILRHCGFIKKTSETNLSGNVLEFKKLKDLNRETYNEGIINCIEFHPRSTAALVAGNTGVASLFAVDGKNNNKLHSVAFQQFPIICSKFTQDGNEAILGSRKPYMYTYDLMSAKAVRVPLPHGLTQCKKFVLSPDSKFMAVAGKWGEVHLLSGKSKERLNILKQDGNVTALAFSPSGDILYGHSDTGEVTMWDMKMGRVKHKWTDEGCLQGSSLSISSSDQFLVTGSMQGVVNLYGTEDVLKNKLPKPRKTIFNLTTPIADLAFNSSSETFVFYSSDIENSVKLFHVGSGSVYSNFPQFGQKLGNVTCANFSPGSGYIAFGNKKSVVSIYRLKHFKSY